MSTPPPDPYGLVEARAAAADIVAIYCDACAAATPEQRQTLRYTPVIGAQLRPIGLFDTRRQRLAASLRPVQRGTLAPVSLVIRWLWHAGMLVELAEVGQVLSLENELRLQAAEETDAGAADPVDFSAGGGGD